MLIINFNFFSKVKSLKETINKLEDEKSQLAKGLDLTRKEKHK